MNETQKGWGELADEARAKGIAAGCEHCAETQRCLAGMLNDMKSSPNDTKAPTATTSKASFGGTWLIVAILVALGAFAALAQR